MDKSSEQQHNLKIQNKSIKKFNNDNLDYTEIKNIY